jgi:hypothetical protein
MYYYVGSKVVNVMPSDMCGFRYKVSLQYDCFYYTNKSYNVGDVFNG